MATYTVTDPTTNKSVDLEGDSPPSEQELNQIFSQVHGDAQPQQPQGNGGFMGQVKSAFNAYNQNPAFSTSPQGLLQKGFGIAKEAANRAGDYVTDASMQALNQPNASITPESWKAPLAAAAGTAVSMTPDVLASFGPAGESTGMTAENEASSTPSMFQKVKQNILPPLLKSTKGIPTGATRMAIDNPDVLNLPGTSESIQGKSQNIIDTIKEANQKVGNDFRGAYAEQGMNSPVDNTISQNSGPLPSKNFSDLKNDYHSAMSGDLFKSMNKAGGTELMSDQQKLSTLTDLKRSLQDQAIYPPPGQQLAPSQGAYNAAIKKMAADIDNLRGTVPGGDKLALADDAYSEMKQISHNLMSAFKDPHTGQDYLNRILKGNTDWLTSGRMAGKVGAIERVEQITGKQILQPALKEMAAAYLNNPDSMGLPSTKLTAIISHFIPAKALLRGATEAGGELPKSILNTGPAATSLFDRQSNQTSKSSIPLFNKAAQAPQQGNDQLPNEPDNVAWMTSEPANNQDFKPADFSIPKQVSKSVPQQNKYLDDQTAMMYLDKANGDKEKARKMATQDGYTVI